MSRIYYLPFVLQTIVPQKLKSHKHPILLKLEATNIIMKMYTRRHTKANYMLSTKRNSLT